MSAIARSVRRLLSWTALAYLVGAVAAAVALRTLTDVWWPITVLAYAPRWLLVLPLPFLALALAVARRWRLLAAMLPAAIALVFALDFRIGLRAAAAGGAPLTVVTLNSDGARTPDAKLRELLRTTGAQIVALQECELDPDQFGDDSWHIHREHELCLLSRFPFASVEARDSDEIRARGGHGSAVRYVVDTPAGPMAIVNIHLQTVRPGLDELIDHGLAGRAGMAANTRIRELDSSTLRAWIDGHDGHVPTIVLGDFNLPVESAIYRRHWSSFGNAFSSAGFGLGWTKRTRWHGTRIDQILFTPGLACLDARVGPNVGSDHRPVIAHLALAGR
ncbi:MAG TPA: endonuclease/exonuclease/phosphatase family protein [Polyangia bacterium]